MSPALSGSSAIRRFEGNDAIEIHDGITFEFYTGLPHIWSVFHIQLAYHAWLYVYTFILIGLFQALRKKQLIASGQLGKFGKILETTPADVKKEFEL